MEQNPTDKQMSPAVDLRSLEGGLKVLWERVKQAGELLSRLREERAALQTRVNQLERSLVEQRDLVKNLEAEQALNQTRGNQVFPDGEREALAVKVKDLLAKIEAYL